MAILFKTTKELEAQIDQFLDSVSQGGMVFKAAVGDFLDDDRADFEQRRSQLDELEEKADDLRRIVETKLYTQTLIPEHRGDVLGLLESTDNVIDAMKDTLNKFDVEKPYIPEELKKAFIELTEVSVQAAEVLVSAIRAFFTDLPAVKDHLHKVYFYENEADRVGDNLRRQAFAMKMELCQKFHLRYFSMHIQNVSDEAEDVADRLAIYSIKRTI